MKSCRSKIKLKPTRASSRSRSKTEIAINLKFRAWNRKCKSKMMKSQGCKLFHRNRKYLTWFWRGKQSPEIHWVCWIHLSWVFMRIKAWPRSIKMANLSASCKMDTQLRLNLKTQFRHETTVVSILRQTKMKIKKRRRRYWITRWSS